MPKSASAPTGDGRAVPPDQSASASADPASPRQGLGLVWIRVVQFSVDLAIVATLSWATSLLMELLPKAPDGTYGDPIAALVALLMVLAAVGAINIVYWIVWPARHVGQTPAMSLFGLRVVSTSGARATSAQLALRTLFLAADGLFFGLVAVVTMLSNPARQRLGDLVANTIVIPTQPWWRRTGGELENRPKDTPSRKTPKGGGKQKGSRASSASSA